MAKLGRRYDDGRRGAGPGVSSAAVDGIGMRSLSVQVQPERSPGMSIEAVTAEFASIAANADLVGRHLFESGEDGGPYFNFTFGARKPHALWREIWERIYENAEIGPHMKRASMAMCADDDGWDHYLQLFHFDPSVYPDAASALPD